MSPTPPTILVTDDEAPIVYILEGKFRRAGFTVLTARNGREGLAAAIEHRPDLIVTDYNMPIMDGMEFSEALAADAATAAIPVIMLTARGHTVDERALAQTRICHLESKPFSARQLLTRVEAILAEGAAAARAA